MQQPPGPVFIYSNFKGYGGIKPIVKVLEHLGYQNYMQYGEGKKRFAIMSGDENNTIKDEIKNVYNQESNIDGNKLKIILGTPSIKEGISFYNVRQIHILEPYWNWSRLYQIIGRGSRYCSHKMLPINERTLDVFIYIAIHPNEIQTIDQHILDIANVKDKLTNKFNLLLQESAIDRVINKNANEN